MLRTSLVFAALCSFGLLTPLTSAPAAEFRAAADKADITPAESVVMWGYGDRSGPATGDRCHPNDSRRQDDDEHTQHVHLTSRSALRS